MNYCSYIIICIDMRIIVHAFNICSFISLNITFIILLLLTQLLKNFIWTKTTNILDSLLVSYNPYSTKYAVNLKVLCDDNKSHFNGNNISINLYKNKDNCYWKTWNLSMCVCMRICVHVKLLFGLSFYCLSINI